MTTNGRGLRSEASPASNVRSINHRDFAFAPPSCRVITCALRELESQWRKRTKYDLVHVTQEGDTYTLFFLLKPEYRKDQAPAQPGISEDNS